MPWTKSDVDDFKEGLNDKQKEKWVEIANSILDECLNNGGSQKTCEAKAIKQANGVVGNMLNNNAKGEVVQICAHVQTSDDKVRTEKVVRPDGKEIEYLVAPVVAVGEGVLKGKFLPSEEIQYTANLWEDSPLPVMHPEDAAGNKISARSREIIEKKSVGRFYNVHYEDGKLKGELWIDIGKAQGKGGEYEKVLEKIRNNEKLEVSTGFFSSPEPQSGNYEGNHYNAVHRGVIPDHLSLLPNAKGECSWADGCGAPRINKSGDYMDTELTGKEIFENARETPRTPEYTSVTESSWSAPNLEDYGYDSVQEIPNDIDVHPAEHSLLGEKNGDNWAVVSVLPVVDENGVLYKSALVNAKARVGQVSGISSDTVEAVKNKCDQLLEKEFGVESNMETEEKSNSKKFYEHVKSFFTRGEDKMDREQLVSDLAEKMETNEDNFEKFDDDELEEFGKKFGIIKTETEEEDEETEETESEEMQTNSDSESETQEETFDSKEKFLNHLTEEGKKEIDEYLEQRKKELETEERRQELISNIKEYDDSIDEENLEDAPVKTLETMLSSLKPADFSGQGGPRDETSDKDLEWLENREERIRGEE